MHRIVYDYDKKGTIILPPGVPFDGKPVLIKLATGWVEAWWMSAEKHETLEGLDYSGFCWVCLDDSAPQADLDDAKAWAPLPSWSPPPGCTCKTFTQHSMCYEACEAPIPRKQSRIVTAVIAVFFMYGLASLVWQLVWRH